MKNDIRDYRTPRSDFCQSGKDEKVERNQILNPKSKQNLYLLKEVIITIQSSLFTFFQKRLVRLGEERMYFFVEVEPLFLNKNFL